jgi:serine/threonine-protein kinase
MKFGQYELLEPIAIGGMAEVFKGRVVAAEGFEKYVAIKRILPDLAADERFVKMLLTEARIHSALSHRNIVQIHDLGISENGEYFIVLEYVEGYDLRIITEQLARDKEIIPEALSLYIAAEVAEGLHFAHEMRGPDGQALGLVHRDVTPSNVLISFAGEVKLSDFGLAKRRHDNSVVGSLKGNLAYMSPEQAKQAPLDRRTDIFSLGALLFELLTGRRLREITDEVAGWSQVASGVVPSARRLRPDLPAPIERLLDVALAAEPAHRFPDAATFGAAIRDALAKLNIAVGASDLAALLGLITPQKRARSLMLEPSKVIRLGSEAQALREAIAAPATPAPVVSPGMTPASSRAIDLASARYRDPAATPQVEILPPAESRDPLATPMPAGPLPPARTRGYTPHAPSEQPARPRGRTPLPGDGRPRGRTPLPGDGRPRGRTPLPGDGRPRARTPLPGDGRPRGRTPLPGDGRPRGPTPLETDVRPRARTPLPGDGRPRGRTPLPGDRSRTQAPTPAGGNRPVNERPRQAAPTPSAGVRALPGRPTTQPFGTSATPPGSVPSGPANASGPNNPLGPPAGDRGPLFRTPSYGVRRPSGPIVAIGPGGAPPGPAPRRPTAPPAHGIPRRPTPPPGQGIPRRLTPPPGQGPYALSREQRETARVQLRARRPWGRWVLALVVLLGGAAAGVHKYVVPLDVLATWLEPARLSISSEPSGATVLLDGVPLAQPAPVTLPVRRDRAEHVIDAKAPGYLPARETVRYDRSVGLAFVVRLEKDPTAAPAAPDPKDGTTAAPAAPDPKDGATAVTPDAARAAAH